VARDGAPVVQSVDDAIFTRRYFGHCMSCGFCADACCQHGVDVSIVERDRILARANELAPRVGRDVSEWFEPVVTADEDFPGGGATRTTVVEGRCVFLSRDTRGCVLHAMSLETKVDYHLLKPMVSALFPVTFGGGALLCSEELADGSLVCATDGPTAYEMARAELAYYFGDAFVEELDLLASSG
jgi:Fe-S-cluster containining protein